MTRDELAKKYFPYTWAVAKKHWTRLWELEELQGVAALGLTWALNKYDETRGAQFSTFAFRCMHSSVTNYVRDNLMPKRDSRNQLSLNELCIDNGKTTIQDMLYAEDNTEEAAILAVRIGEMKKAISGLSKQQRRVCELLLLGDFTEQYIAGILGVAQSTVNKFKSRAFKNLRLMLQHVA